MPSAIVGLLLLVLAVLLNVAVAWGCAWGQFGTWERPPPVGCRLGADPLPPFPATPVGPFLGKGWKFGLHVHSKAQLDLNHIAYSENRWLAGWPMKSLEGFAFNEGPFPDGVDLQMTAGALFVSNEEASLLPFLPLWPGFLIKSLLYAFVLWLLFRAPFIVMYRRRSRRRRGLCTKCGYLQGTSAVCTECGSPVSIVRSGTIIP